MPKKETKPTRVTKKQAEKFYDNSVIIDGDFYPQDSEEVKEVHKELRVVEQGYVDFTVDNFLDQIEQKREEITSKIINYCNSNMVDKLDRDGVPTGKREINVAAKNMDEYIVNRLFFSSLCPLTSKEPRYNAEKLALVFDLYEDLVAKTNTYVCQVIPSKSHFCRFAGITTATYNGYKLSEDPDMQVVMGKIEDMLVDVHLSMAEEFKTNSNAAKYRLNIEMDKRENYNPQVVIKADVKDLQEYQDRISSLANLDYEILDGGDEEDG